MLHSSSPYIVYWVPAGESIPAGSESLIERFLTDSAADSGKSSNVFGVLRQYHDYTGFADYRQTFDPARQVIVDTQPYPAPASGCSAPDSAYPTCLSDQQIQTEVRRLVAARRLPTDGKFAATELPANAPVYMVILPANVDACTGKPLCTNDQICAYHWNTFDTHNHNILYGVLPLESLQDGSLIIPAPLGVCQLDGRSAVQALDGDVNADLLINALGHEYSEAITDPINNTGWTNTRTVNEVGDLCELNATLKLPPGFASSPLAYLPTLGGSEATGTLFTQLIHGDRYYLQSEWSNGVSTCAMRPPPGKIAARFAVTGRERVGSPLRFNPAASTSTHGYSSATWSFGDGSHTTFLHGHATLSPTAHRYRRAGTYAVTLTLVDTVGNLKTTTRRMTIRPRKG